MRHRHVEAALRRGEYAHLDERFAVAFTIAGALLGVSTLALLFVES